MLLEKELSWHQDACAQAIAARDQATYELEQARKLVSCVRPHQAAPHPRALADAWRARARGAWGLSTALPGERGCQARGAGHRGSRGST